MLIVPEPAYVNEWGRGVGAINMLIAPSIRVSILLACRSATRTVKCRLRSEYLSGNSLKIMDLPGEWQVNQSAHLVELGKTVAFRPIQTKRKLRFLAEGLAY